MLIQHFRTTPMAKDDRGKKYKKFTFSAKILDFLTIDNCKQKLLARSNT